MMISQILFVAFCHLINNDKPVDWSSCSWGGAECLVCAVAVSHQWPGPPRPPGTSRRLPPGPPRCLPAPPRSPRWRSRCHRCRPGRGRWGDCSVSGPARRAGGGQPDCPGGPAPPCVAQLTYLEHCQSGEAQLDQPSTYLGCQSEEQPRWAPWKFSCPAPGWFLCSEHSVTALETFLLIKRFEKILIYNNWTWNYFVSRVGRVSWIFKG